MVFEQLVTLTFFSKEILRKQNDGLKFFEKRSPNSALKGLPEEPTSKREERDKWPLSSFGIYQTHTRTMYKPAYHKKVSAHQKNAKSLSLSFQIQSTYNVQPSTLRSIKKVDSSSDVWEAPVVHGYFNIFIVWCV